MKSYMMMRVALAAIFFGSTLSATRVRGAECVARVPLHGNTLCVRVCVPSLLTGHMRQ